ncbi:hypothetical protein NQ314_007858 [Rhamnusium bicolor]|uniref:Uncharacterized protein n=1 Tax=Rhamnusium bicolor TaxID=1586634 RepID=A0AAV8YHL6_9CUCU|nr:hypothetical protein NQ314_007858 [Rhamnusium bicolor]
MAVLKGWRFAVLIGGLVGAIGIAMYPIVVDPMLNPEKYSMYLDSLSCTNVWFMQHHLSLIILLFIFKKYMKA